MSWTESLAQETNDVVLESPEIKRVRLLKGNRAPFDGNLLSDSAVAKILTDHKAKIRLLETELKFTKQENELKILYSEEKNKLDLTLLNNKYDNLLKAYNEKIEFYDNAIDRLSNSCKKACSRKWYESPLFIGSAGMLLVGGILGLVLGVTL